MLPMRNNISISEDRHLYAYLTGIFCRRFSPFRKILESFQKIYKQNSYVEYSFLDTKVLISTFFNIKKREKKHIINMKEII
jgi:hypothetical protein